MGQAHPRPVSRASRARRGRPGAPAADAERDARPGARARLVRGAPSSSTRHSIPRPANLKRHWRPGVALAVALVGVTIAAVAVWRGCAFPACLGPRPSLSAPSSRRRRSRGHPPSLKQMRPPHRLLVILEGESLFNDASALLVYRLVVGAAMAGKLLPLVGAADAARGLQSAASSSERSSRDSPSSSSAACATSPPR